MNNPSILIKNKRLIGILIAATLLLSIPLAAMMFTTEVDWKASDFLIMGVLLFGTGLLCEGILRKVKNTRYRFLICGAILFALLLTWAELAVGIFGTPFAGS